MSGLFPSRDPEPAMSYDDMAAQLLADVADLLLSGKKDWATLERLQDALKPPAPQNRYLSPAATSGKYVPSTTGTSSGLSEMVRSIYEPKIEEDLKRQLSLYHSRLDDDLIAEMMKPDPEITKKIRDASYTVNFSRMSGKTDALTYGLLSDKWIEKDDKE